MNKSKGSRPIFILVIASFLLSTVVSLVSLHVMSQRNVREMNKVLATQVYDYIRGELTEPIMVARTMANDSLLRRTITDEEFGDQQTMEQALHEYLQGIESGLGCESTFVIPVATGDYYTSTGRTRTINPTGQEDEWYRTFLDSPLLYDLGVDYDETSKNDLTVYVNAKIIDTDEQAVGVCGLGVRMTGIQELFRALEEDFNVKVDLVDTNGLVQVDVDEASIGHTSLAGLIPSEQGEEYMYQEVPGGGFSVVKYIENLDWYLIVQSNGTHNAGQFANVVLVNFVLCVLVLVILVLAIRYSRKRTAELTNASYKDAATSLYNRRSFEKDKATLLEMPLSEDFVCLTADVNGLKTANDTLGHDAGDELIMGAAECLRSCFSEYGKVYRIGGDEFAALIEVPYARLLELREEFAKTVEAWSGKKVDALSISYGYASSLEFPSLDVLDLCRLSDKRMYADKEQYYRRTGIERRRT